MEGIKGVYLTNMQLVKEGTSRKRGVNERL